MTSDSPLLLRRALRANAAFSALSGATFLVGSEPVAAFLGDVPPLLVVSVGAPLLIFAAALVWLAGRERIPPGWVNAVVLADLTWVLGTALVVFADVLLPRGAAAAVAVGNAVALFAALQWIGARRMSRAQRPEDPASRTAGAPRVVVVAAVALVALPLAQVGVERLVALPLGPSRMLTIALWAVAWIPIAGFVLSRFGRVVVSRPVRWAVAVVVPLVVVAHLIALGRLGDGPFGPVPGGPFDAAATPAPPSWDEAATLRYAELEVDRTNPRTLETLVLVHEGTLFVAANMPERKRWPSVVRAQESVRIRLGGEHVHTLRARMVDSPEEGAELLERMEAKYGFDVSLGEPIWFFALSPGEETAYPR